MPFAIIESKEVRSRKDFAALCNARSLFLAVEVGTDQGWFAAEFLEKWDGYQLYCVDPYAPYPEMDRDRSPDLMFAVSRLTRFLPRVRIIRMDSTAAAKHLGPLLPQLGFVYIDADHREESVKRDIETWWPLVRPGGVLAGHDFDAEHVGVVAAVTGFARENCLTVHKTLDAHTTPSWYIPK